MARRRVGTLVAAIACGLFVATSLAAQTLAPSERAALDDWYRRTADRTGRGEWGVAMGTMDGRMLWSMSAEAALIPASTAKVFTTGFTRARVGGDSRLPRGSSAMVRSTRSGRWRQSGRSSSAGTGRSTAPGAMARPSVSSRDSLREGGVRVSSRARSRSSAARGRQRQRSIPASGRPTSRAGSTRPRSGRWPCTRTPSHSPSARAATPARRRQLVSAFPDGVGPPGAHGGDDRERGRRPALAHAERGRWVDAQRDDRRAPAERSASRAVAHDPSRLLTTGLGRRARAGRHPLADARAARWCSTRGPRRCSRKWSRQRSTPWRPRSTVEASTSARS